MKCYLLFTWNVGDTASYSCIYRMFITYLDSCQVYSRMIRHCYPGNQHRYIEGLDLYMFEIYWFVQIHRSLGKLTNSSKTSIRHRLQNKCMLYFKQPKQIQYFWNRYKKLSLLWNIIHHDIIVYTLVRTVLITAEDVSCLYLSTLKL